MQRFRFLLSVGLVGCVGMVAVFACTPPTAKKTPLRTTPDKSDDDDDVQGDDDVTPPDIKPESDPPLPDGGKPPGRVYAHTARALYLFDPLVMKLTKIGDFKGLDANDDVIDLAVDRDNVVYGTTFGGFIRIDPIDASVTYVQHAGTIANPQYPNALAFMPLGTVDMTKEALVGYGPPIEAGGTQYLRIDTQTGAITKIGELNDVGAAVKFKSAGDIISMERNGKAYLAVKKVIPPAEPDAAPPPPPGNDMIAEIDPATGRLKSIIGDIGSDETFGLAQWAGTAYGFNAKGNIIKINLTTGKGETIMTLPEDAGTGGWYGAGVTTDAPTRP